MYHYLPIHPALQGIVSQMVIIHIDFEQSMLSPVYRFPFMSNAHLVFPLSDNGFLIKKKGDEHFRFHSGAYFAGPKLVNDTVDFGKEKHALYIVFKPGSIRRMTGITGKHVLNIDVCADYIFGNGITEIAARLRNTTDRNELLTIIESFLFKLAARLAPETTFDTAIDMLLQVYGNMTIGQFASLACKSIRQVERLSIEYLGMAPRLFGKLVRFGKAYSMKEAVPDFSWSNIAYEFGYFDQMHLVRDFKKFAGLPPMELDLSSASSVKMMAALYSGHLAKNQ